MQDRFIEVLLGPSRSRTKIATNVDCQLRIKAQVGKGSSIEPKNSSKKFKNNWSSLEF